MAATRSIQITGNLAFGGDNPPLFIAGPCVIESRQMAFDTSGRLKEICAELGAAYLGAHLGLPPDHLHDHSAYIGDWIALMQRDRRAFLDAAAKAQAAVDWLLVKSGLTSPFAPTTEGKSR